VTDAAGGATGGAMSDAGKASDAGTASDAGAMSDAGAASAAGDTGSLRLWGGRFAGGPADALANLSRSTHFDWRLAPHDLAASRAHARVLHRAALLSDAELSTMLDALNQLDDDVRSGAFAPTPVDEDVHTALERGLVERLGDLGGKLRAGRSRNDQVATDLRLYLRDAARAIAGDIARLQTAVLDQAEALADAPAPGFTHLQHAQPVSFGHELAKHAHALARDVDRFRDWDRRAAFCPLGAGALAGSSLPIDPAAVAAELGFTAPTANSIDAVSDRDFAAEFAFVSAMVAVHLARLGEEVCLWVSREFGWATLDDAYATGSSIMPQKKNPDIAELARGKSGRMIGHVTAILAMLKGLPFAYNRDLQEDKEPVFDGIDTLTVLLPAVTGMVASLRFDTARMEAAAPEGFALATEIADWLVRRGTSFRDAHEIAGEVVRYCEQNGKDLSDLTSEELASVSAWLGPDVRSVLTVRGALQSRTAPGGTAPVRVREQIAALRVTVLDGAAWAGSR
jgi:argininosuccinate lyase